MSSRALRDLYARMAAGEKGLGGKAYRMRREVEAERAARRAENTSPRVTRRRMREAEVD